MPPIHVLERLQLRLSQRFAASMPLAQSLVVNLVLLSHVLSSSLKRLHQIMINKRAKFHEIIFRALLFPAALIDDVKAMLESLQVAMRRPETMKSS
jgi:hypothetical protein